MVLYVGVAAFALSFWWAIEAYQGVDDGGLVLRSLVAAVVGLMLVMPAGFALAMAKE